MKIKGCPINPGNLIGITKGSLYLSVLGAVHHHPGYYTDGYYGRPGDVLLVLSVDADAYYHSFETAHDATLFTLKFLHRTMKVEAKLHKTSLLNLKIIQ